MNKIAKITSLIALLATIVPCVLFYLGNLEINNMKWATLAATIIWFVATPIWIGQVDNTTDN